MNSDTIFATLEQIAATPGKNDKLAIIKSHSSDDDFKRVMEYAYNPFKTYGIKKRPESFGGYGCHEFGRVTWEILDDLISRKLSGNAAIEAVRGEMSNLTMQSAELFWRIIKTDLRAGFSESTINKAVKGLIPEFPYQRCCLPKDTKLDEFDWEAGVVSQEKADGMYANVDYESEEEIRITSRQGSPFPIEKFGALVSEIRTRLIVGNQHHGEVLVRKGGVIQAREIGNGILNSVLKGGDFEADEVPVYMVWDSIPLSAVVSKGKHHTAYKIRLINMMRSLTASPSQNGSVFMIPTRLVHSLEEAYAHYRELLEVGKEGTVIKDPRAIWRDGTSKQQVKLKLEVDVDLKVVSIVPGKAGGKNEGRAGSLRCTTSCCLLVVDVTVKNEKLRDLIDADNDDWIDRVIVVRANEVMEPSGSGVASLFLPRMVEVGYRTDKTEADSLQRVRDQFEAAVKAA